jgi:hypothetical protein
MTVRFSSVLFAVLGGLASAQIAAAGQASPSMASPNPVASPSPAAATGTRVADLGWIAGRWVSDTQGRYSEEVWTGPAGGTMLGMWRVVQSGRAQIFELLALSEEPEGIMLRLRHFDPKLVAREDKESPVALRLIGVQGARATFEGPGGASGPLRLIYHRTGARTLAVTLERDGKKEEFRFERKDALPPASPAAAPASPAAP